MSRRPKRAPRKSYSDDAFAGLDELDDILGPQDPDLIPASEPEDDFVADPAAEEDVAEDDDLSAAASDDGASASGINDEDDDDDLVVVDPRVIRAKKKNSSFSPNIRAKMPKAPRSRLAQHIPRRESDDDSHSENEKHARTVLPNKGRPGRNPAGVMMMGSNLLEVQNLINAKHTFFSEVTLPHRRIAIDYEHISPPAWAIHAVDGQDAWDATMSQAQRVSRVDADQMSLFTSHCTTTTFLAGPPKDPKLCHLKPHTVLPLDDLFSGQSQQGGSARPRPAWVINVGIGVQCLEWAPQRQDGRHYLAISSAPAGRSNAFSASGPSPSTIDIWCIRAKPSPQADWAASMDMDEAPLRRLVLCTDFGHIVALKWSPKKAASTGHDFVDLGLLAVASSDGHLRVFGISFEADLPSETEFRKLETTPFDVAALNTVCTCITWLSDSLLAAGCSNGYVGIWDVKQCVASGNTDPFFWHELSLTYILSISACLPSRPGMLITSSMDGFVRLTSVADPSTDFVISPRSRIGSAFVAWHDQSQHVLHLEDLYNLRAINLRRGWSTVYVSTLAGPAQAAGVSANHSALLLGCTDGTAQIINPMRRVFAKSFHNADYLQTWFTHDWHRGEQDLARLTTGYSVENAKDTTGAGVFNKNTHAPESQAQSRVTAKGVIFATTYEQEAGIRVVTWNPNPSVQGWAAAGMGDGLVLIEDLCWD